MTDKQTLFCEYYIQCWNATESARKAGYEGDDNTLGVVGYENLRKPKIKEYIDKRIAEVAMSSNEVLYRLSQWGRGTIEPFILDNDNEGVLSINSEEAKNAIGLIKKIKQFETSKQVDEEEILISRRFEIELHDAKDAVIQLAKIRGMYVDKVEHSGTLSHEAVVKIVNSPSGS